MGEVDEIDLRIHSQGGSVLDGWAIANGLKSHAATVTGTVEGMAASMASVVLMACDVRRVPKNAYVMIHDVAGGAFGGVDDLESMVALMKKLQGDIVDFYAERSGMDSEDLVEMMKKETWMNGDDALENGFADEVLEEVKIAASADVDRLEARFVNLPEAFKAAEPEEDEEGGEPEPENDLEPEAENAGGALKTISNLIAKLNGGASGDDGSEVSAVSAVTWRADTAEARVVSLEADVIAMRGERDELKSKVVTLEAEAMSLVDAVTANGFSLADTDGLPGADGGEGGVDSADADTQYRSIENAAERQKFFKENESAILAARKAKG